MAAWLATNTSENVAWYSLEEDDNDPICFFTCIAAALQTVAPVSALESALGAAVANPRELTVALLNDLFVFSDRSVVLVFDDYHHITRQPIHDALVYLIDHLPNNIHLVFISRVDPPLPLGRWRVRGQLTEIRADDLRFTEAEAAQFLNQTMGLSLSAEAIRTLEERTEGWVAGLQLAALSLQKSSNPGQIIAAFAGSNRYVADYLTDEVLARQPESLRDFLLKTSILERFNAALCNHLLQCVCSESILTDLERANLFIIPLDSDANWYRYHHLFADLLKRRLAQANPAGITDLHRRAAEWFEQNNFTLDAIRHWIAADEPERVAALMERTLSQSWGHAELAGLMHRIEALPDTVLAKYPILSAFLGWTWLWLGYDNARTLPLLERAERNLKDEPQASYARGRFQVIRSYIARAVHNDAPHAWLLAEQALQQLAEHDLLWRGFAQSNIAIVTHSMGLGLAQTERAYNEAIRLCRAAGDPTTAWIAECARVQVVRECGDLQRSMTLNRRLIDMIERQGAPALVRGWVHINQALGYYLINDLKHAWLEVNMTQNLQTQSSGMPDVSLRLYALLTRLELLNGNEAAARQAADDLVTLAYRGGVTNAIDWAYAVRAELMFRLKDWAAFDSYARTYQPPQQPLFFPYRLQTLLQVRYLTRQKAWNEGRRLVAEQVRLAREAGYVEYEMELHIVSALLEQKAGNPSVAMNMLGRALEIGKANGYVRIFLEEGEEMRHLLTQIHRLRRDDFVAELLAAFGKPAQVVQSSLIEPLTEREIEVLRLIAEGLSNPEIAEKLVLSVGTVKTHVKHIYGKLNVDDRVKAAGMARELGLLK
ncbi:LuxR C-terminal-related transcriptional regulator [Chloroflexus aurantiacus]|jgi:LuxR family maltose regulon positive regulatory protein|nr:LuxR C-terminal-related transcriptional regulator [Chloroflexus aurantiacus]